MGSWRLSAFVLFLLQASMVCARLHYSVTPFLSRSSEAGTAISGRFPINKGGGEKKAIVFYPTTRLLVADTLKPTGQKVLESAPKVKRYPLPLKSRNFRTGQLLPFFEARDIRGELFNLKATRGKVVVVNFWFISCAPCRREMPELNALVASYEDTSRVQFISIALDPKDKLDTFLATSPFSYRVIDNGRALANRYGVLSYPTHVVLDQEGRIAFHSVGYAALTSPWLRKTIDRLLRQSAPVHP